MKPEFDNLIPCVLVRKDTSNKPKVLSIVGLPADREYELYPNQPKEGDVDYDLVYLTSRGMLWAIKKNDLQKLK